MMIVAHDADLKNFSRTKSSRKRGEREKYPANSVYKSKKEAHLKKMIPVKRAKLDGKALQRDEIITKIKELEEV
jgi:hypothetical protein